MTDVDPAEPMVGLTPRAARLALAIEDSGRGAIPLRELWGLWDSADPSSAGRPERRAALARALGELNSVGLIRVSKTSDRIALPHLPTRVTVPRNASRVTAAAVARSVAWRPELSWVLQARLTLGQVTRLKSVNTWLRDHGKEPDVLPLRERSLAIFSHEKELDKLMQTGVFGPGRLTLDLLRTFRTHPPLPSVRVGRGPVLLVIENDNTFSSIRAALGADPGPVGHLAWGAGGAFEASILSCRELDGISRIRYYGDLDVDGLRIPRNAAATAVDEGMPEVLPADSLYRRLLATKDEQANQPRVPTDQAVSLTCWFRDPGLALGIIDLLGRGVRIPQEALNATLLRADRSWIHDL
ncbi:hypothetical protein FB561_5690 [Kribbella amoyensis]|uniref:Wadjet protein JetD C-terminal domain-containing protein n=1 Tax=Kribbella amoyensis TaxID=996641 RepID=A0A561BZZ4_9ACTN|nr:hypothetical protein [Kribbella amoyensis]TWD84499.1 hypothetical protein FB561_5690 [Kribbella amoyensis]